MYRFVTIISILACFVPLFILLGRKLWKEQIYVLIGLFWLFNGLINIAVLFNIPTSARLDEYIVVTADYLDVPFVLYIFYLASEGLRKKITIVTLFSFIGFELVVSLFKGYNYASATIILGASLVVILLFGIAGIASYIVKIEHTPKEKVMVFIYSSFLFFYGSFIIVYFFSYIFYSGGDQDTIFLYYIELMLGSILSIYGLAKYASLHQITNETRRKVEGF
ncbi:MAG: hypothetical protein H7Y03_00185 [Chitinophagaceae bacterium]|nr:hypothetical protein [Chitinophagaceae bacterium]